MGKRGTSQVKQNQPERRTKQSGPSTVGAMRQKRKTPQEFERSEADGSNLLSGPTKEDRRAEYWRAPRGAEPSASTPMAGPKGDRMRLLPARSEARAQDR